jgi:3-hydroxymyristoyl/3-hydroxydecanoyl-(acyl carrier protein) dehydratase
VTPTGSRAAPLPAVDTWRVRGDLCEFTIDARTQIRAEPYLRGHFPGYPIFPGVFVLEAVCQVMAVAFGELGWDGGSERPVPSVSAVRSLRFLAPLLPGDVMSLELTAVSTDRAGWLVTARARRSDGTVAARVRATFGGPPPACHVVDAAPGTVSAAPAGWEYTRIHRTMPHRHPFLLIDRVIEVGSGTIRATKAISATDPCYRWLGDDLTPSSTAYPVSLLVESLGQAAVLLWLDGNGSAEDAVLLFVGARDYRIVGDAVPGDVLEHVVQLESVVSDTIFATGQTRVGGRLIATAASLIATRRSRKTLASNGTITPQEHQNG